MSSPRAFNAVSDLSMDEMVREHKHWGKARFKFKPNVHSGALVDALCCCRTRYCPAIEEQGTCMLEGSAKNECGARALRLLLLAGCTDKSHILHLDRGYSVMKLLTLMKEHGTYVNMNIQCNRKGMPREAMKIAAVEIAAGQDWSWTVFHKGDIEVVVWRDGDVVLNFVSNALSAQWVGTLRRSVGKTDSYCVCVPYPLWAYNVYGRSGVDGMDQFRKQQQTSARRTVRNGVKGMLFVIDICLSNAAILMLEHQPVQEKVAPITKVEFYRQYTNWVFQNLTARRRQKPATVIGSASPDNRKTGKRSRTFDTAYSGHRLVDPNLLQDDEEEEVVSDGRYAGGVRTVPKKKQHKRKQGRCFVCTSLGTKKTSIWTKFFCPKCESWYHPECFFKLRHHQIPTEHTKTNLISNKRSKPTLSPVASEDDN